MIARLILVPLGLAFAAATAFVCLVLGSLASPDMALLIARIVERIGDVAAGAALGNPDDAMRIVAFAGATWKLGVALIFAPTLLVAIVCEVFGVRSFLAQGIGVALLTAATPYMMLPRTTEAADGLPGPLLAGLLVSGLFAGAVYWLIAGRGAGGEQRGVSEPAS